MMQLPTQAEVNAAARHLASFVGGALVAFGLATKIDPNTVQALITASGNLINDMIALIGIATPLYMAWIAKSTAAPAAQAAAVAQAAQAGTLPTTAQVAVLNAAAAVPGTQKVVNPVLAAVPETSTKVTST